MKKNLLGALLMGCTLALVGQPPAALPREIYQITHKASAGSAADHIVLINTLTKKKMKVALPMPSHINETPHFINSYVIQIRAVKNSWDYLNHNQPYFLFVPSDEGGFFVKEPESGRTEFSWVKTYGNDCAFNVSNWIFSADGSTLLGRYAGMHDKTLYLNQARGAGASPEFYDLSTCRKLSLTVPTGSQIVGLGEQIGYLQGDTLGLFDIATNKLIGQFRTLPTAASDVFVRARFTPSLPMLYQSQQLFPVRVNASQWTYINQRAMPQMPAFDADLALPFLFPNKRAPVQYKGKWGIMDPEGKMTVPFQFDSLTLGNSPGNSVLSRNDSMFVVDANGAIAYWKPPKPPAAANEKQYGAACLVYGFLNPKAIWKDAYVLVDITYDPRHVDHSRMSQWTLNAIQREISGLWENGYSRSGPGNHNIYRADVILERGCYHYESEYKQKTTMVSVLRKQFD